MNQPSQPSRTINIQDTPFNFAVSVQSEDGQWTTVAARIEKWELIKILFRAFIQSIYKKHNLIRIFSAIAEQRLNVALYDQQQKVEQQRANDQGDTTRLEQRNQRGEETLGSIRKPQKDVDGASSMGSKENAKDKNKE